MLEPQRSLPPVAFAEFLNRHHTKAPTKHTGRVCFFDADTRNAGTALLKHLDMLLVLVMPTLVGMEQQIFSIRDLRNNLF